MSSSNSNQNARSSELIINATLPEIRIALLEEAKVQELLIERPSDRGVVGNIYKGKVTRVLPGMQAAFVDIGLEKAAFLYVDDVYHHDALPEEVVEEQEDEEEKQMLLQEEEDLDSEDLQLGDAEEKGEEESATEMNAAPSEEAGLDVIPEPASDEVSEDEDHGMLSMVRDRLKRLSKGIRGKREVDEEDEFEEELSSDELPENLQSMENDRGDFESDRSGIDEYVETDGVEAAEKADDRLEDISETPENEGEVSEERVKITVRTRKTQNFKSRDYRGPKRNHPRDRRMKPRLSKKPSKNQINIQDLLKEGQEVLVQVAKEPISSKGARLTCHVSLPGRYLVAMPTLNHIGVSRKIERDDDRRRFKEMVYRNRKRKMGFIVRTVVGGKNVERQIQDDMDYLTDLWVDIFEKAQNSPAPSLVYEDLDQVLRAVRDWVNDDVSRIVVDSRHHYNELARFSQRFMPSLRSRIELYQGDLPIFDAYGISTEISRAFERKVWLKSGGYIVIDQSEALLSIDVNTGRFVGKKNLEDTIVKTNLEAVEEIAYQLRLRNAGGIIIIDLIDMEREESRQRVYRALENAIKYDRARPTIVKFSDLGLIEMTRKRTRDTLVRALCESCPNCEGKGFLKSRLTVAYEILRDLEREAMRKETRKIVVQAHPEVIDLLAIELRESVDQMERKFRKTIFLQALLDFHVEQYDVMGDKNSEPYQFRDYAKDRAQKYQRFEQRPYVANDSSKQQDQDDEESGPITRGGRDQRDRDRGRRGRRSDRNDRGRNRNQDRDQEAKSSSENLDVGDQENSVNSPVEKVKISLKKSNQTGEDDNFGNRVSDPISNPDHAAENLGNTAEFVGGEDEDLSEEDRLAFLRAQAAQDAAIALMTTGASGGPVGVRNQNGGAKNNRRNQNGRNQRNQNGRGGRFQKRGFRNQRGRNGSPSEAGLTQGRDQSDSSSDSPSDGSSES